MSRRQMNAAYRGRTDALSTVDLQRVVATIRADYPAAASTVDSASVLLCVLAGRMVDHRCDMGGLLCEALVKLEAAASTDRQFACNLRRRIQRHLVEIQA